MSTRRTLLGQLRGRRAGAPTPAPPQPPEPNQAVLGELRALRARVPRLTGTLAASSDGLLIAHDLPGHIEPDGMAALTAAELALAHRLAATAHGAEFDEVVVRGSNGHVVIYAAGATALTVLAELEVNVGKLHLESRPVARAIADHVAVRDQAR